MAVHTQEISDRERTGPGRESGARPAGILARNPKHAARNISLRQSLAVLSGL